MLTLTSLMALFAFTIGTLVFTITNKAIVIRRVWEANFAILTPYVSNQQMMTLRGQFAGISSEEQYRAFRHQAVQIAKEAHVKFRDETDGL